MSLPPATTPPVSATTATLPRFTKWDWVWVGVLTLLLSTGYLVVDIALDPALLPHATRAGCLPVLLVLVSVGFVLSVAIVFELRAKRSRFEWVLNLLCCLSLGLVFPIVAIVWLDPYQPNARNGSVVFTALGLSAIGFTLFSLALVYGLRSAHRRYSRDGAYAESGVPGREEVVGVGSLVWAATGVWFLAVVSASIYAIWLALTSPFDNASLPMPFVIVCTALVLSIGGLGWIWWYAGRYARRTGDAALLASTTVPSAKLATPQRVVVPPDERPRRGIDILVFLGLAAFSLLTFAVLDFRFVQSSYADGQPLYADGPSRWFFSWLISMFIPLGCSAGLSRASARHYQPGRFWRLLVAAAMFVFAGDAVLIDMFSELHAIVSPLGLLAIAMICATVGVLICRSMLLHPMWEGNREPTGATPPMPAASHDATVAGWQKRPRAASNLVLLLPVFILVVHLIYHYGDTAMIRGWGWLPFLMVTHTIPTALAAVVDTDMPQRKARRPAKKGA